LHRCPSLLHKTSKNRCGYAFAGLATLALTCTTATARAQAQPASVDARGSISGSTRFIGLAGAFLPIAEDTEGVAISPASVAVRLPYSWHQWDYGFGIDVAIAGWLPHNDIYNRSGTNTKDSKSTALFGSLAAILNFEHAGLGVSAEAQSNGATQQDQVQGIAPISLTANYGTVHMGLAYGFLDGQLLLGAGPRLLGMSLSGNGSNSGPFSVGSVGYEAGVAINPLQAQYRIGAAVKSPINARVAAGAASVHVPWELALGFAYQFGARPLNTPLLTADQVARRRSSAEPTKAELKQAEDELFEHYQERPRFYLLVSTELALIEGGGAVALAQSPADTQAASSRPIISPRLGLESEVVPNILKLRAGSYYEPARVAEAQSRFHGTGGFDVRLFEWDIFGLIRPFDYWQLSVGADAARSYLNTALSIGFWH
jgi:hypothetical protein